jgi:hypothetical protein
MLFLLLLILIPTIVCREGYQTIPLRYDAAINHLKQYQDYNPIDLLADASRYRITLDEMSSLFASNATTQCERDIELLLEAASRRDMWAIKILDAWGKPLPSGVLKGNIYWVGDYDECLNPMYLTNNKTFLSQPFDTHYCE